MIFQTPNYNFNDMGDNPMKYINDNLFINNITDNSYFGLNSIPLEELIFKHNFMKTTYDFESSEGEKTRGQRFIGGVTFARAGLSKYVISVDKKSLYPSSIMAFNVGIDTLIPTNQLPKELLDLRIKYAIYYPKQQVKEEQDKYYNYLSKEDKLDIESKDMVQYDLLFIKEVLENPKARHELHTTLKKYNVTMTPNGIFFKKDSQSILSKLMENSLSQRNIEKKDKKRYQKLKEKLQEELENTINVYDEIDEKEYSIDELNILISLKENYQMAYKILANSAYGALSISSSVFAGHVEWFATATTSPSRVSNVFSSIYLSRYLSSLINEVDESKQYSIYSFDKNTVQQDTDSDYITLEPYLRFKFGKDFDKNLSKNDWTKITDFMEKFAIHLTTKTRKLYDEVYGYTLNCLKGKKFIDEVELITDSFVSLRPKMYFARKLRFDGDDFLDKFFEGNSELKVTGLSLVRSTTPKFFREKLKKVLQYLVEKDIDSLMRYMKEVREETKFQNIDDITNNMKVNSLDYQWDSTKKRYLRLKMEKDWSKTDYKNNVDKGIDVFYNSAPMQSKASLIHNKFVENNNLGIELIEDGDNIKLCKLLPNNPIGSDTLAYKDKRIFKEGFENYIDYNEIFNKNFINNIKLITDPLDWDLISKGASVSFDF